MSELRNLSSQLYERLQARRDAGVSHERTPEGLARSVETAMVLAGESTPIEAEQAVGRLVAAAG